MRAPAIHPAGDAGVAAPAAPTTSRRGRALLGALLLALTPGLASAAGSDEWPTASDRGPRSPTRIPWMRFSGEPGAPVLATVPGHAVYVHEVVVVRQQELSRRQRRLLRRAQRHAEKAAGLRDRAGGHTSRDTYATVVVPVLHTAPPAPPAPPHAVVVKRGHPKVHVVRLAQEHEHEQNCDDSGDISEAMEHEHDDDGEMHMPIVIDGEKLSADIERQMGQALRDVERARAQAERARERAERARERAQRDVERGHRSRR